MPSPWVSVTALWLARQRQWLHLEWLTIRINKRKRGVWLGLLFFYNCYWSRDINFPQYPACEAGGLIDYKIKLDHLQYKFLCSTFIWVNAVKIRAVRISLSFVSFIFSWEKCPQPLFLSKNIKEHLKESHPGVFRVLKTLG